jgi:hypothetical protein
MCRILWTPIDNNLRNISLELDFWDCSGMIRSEGEKDIEEFAVDSFTYVITPRRTFRLNGETKATKNAGCLDLIH